LPAGAAEGDGVLDGEGEGRSGAHPLAADRQARDVARDRPQAGGEPVVHLHHGRRRLEHDGRRGPAHRTGDRAARLDEPAARPGVLGCGHDALTP
jgi:hypothetical protein